MKYTLGLLLLFAAAPLASSKEQSLLARVTVYWASGGSGSDSWTRKHVAASGAHLRAGHCAVDPRRIPYGSRVILPDGELVAVDTGSAVRSRRAARLCGRSASEKSAIVVDRFFETKGQALSWANQNPQFMTVRVHSSNEALTTVEKARTRVSTTSSTTKQIVSNPAPQTAALRAKAVLTVPAPKLVATNSTRSATNEIQSALANPQQKLLAQYNANEPRSHYGRSVAYTR